MRLNVQQTFRVESIFSTTSGIVHGRSPKAAAMAGVVGWPFALSVGSLRFFALATLLNLPTDMNPQVILLDKPELGLRPAASSLTGDMIRSVSADRHVIVATQSPLLVDAFDIDEIITLDLKEGRTKPRILDRSEYDGWLDEYTTGGLWQKNLLGGHP